MKATVIELERSFLYNGVELPDPDSEMTPEKVLDHYSKQYVSLKRGKIQVKSATDVAIVYEMIRSPFQPNG